MDSIKLLTTIQIITLTFTLCDSNQSNNAIIFDPLTFIRKLEPGKIIIDTDIGSDDAVAILTALQYQNNNINNKTIEIIAITCVYGNTQLDNVKVNILKALKVADSLQIPVYAGFDRSTLVTPPSDNYFGEDGMGDFYFPDPPSTDLIQKEHAVSALTRLARENPGEITLLGIAPLTNIALAIRTDPMFRKNLQHLMLLGGSVDGFGSMPPNVEFNFYKDPEANFIVFNSTDDTVEPLIILPCDTIAQFGLINMNWRRDVLGSIDNDLVSFLNKAERIGTTNSTIWIASDGFLVSSFLYNDIVSEAQYYYILPVTQGEYRGGLIVDKNNAMGHKQNTVVITKVDLREFENFIFYYLNSTNNGTNF